MQIQHREYENKWGVINRWIIVVGSRVCKELIIMPRVRFFITYFTGSLRGAAGGGRGTECTNDLQCHTTRERPRSTCLNHRGFDIPTTASCCCSQKEYGPGYIVIVKTWPNLADTPPCPRKVVEESTLHQHRLWCKATEGRMTGILMSCRQDGRFVRVFSS